MAFVVAARDTLYGPPLGKPDAGIVEEVPLVAHELEAVVVTRMQVASRVDHHALEEVLAVCGRHLDVISRIVVEAHSGVEIKSLRSFPSAA